MRRPRVLFVSQEGLYPQLLGGMEIRGAELVSVLERTMQVGVLSACAFTMNGRAIPHDDITGRRTSPAVHRAQQLSWRGGQLAGILLARRTVARILSGFAPDLIYLNSAADLHAPVMQLLLTAGVPVVAWFGDHHSTVAASLDGTWRDQYTKLLGGFHRAIPSPGKQAIRRAFDNLVMVHNCRHLRDYYTPRFPASLVHEVIYDGVDLRRFTPALALPARPRIAFLARVVFAKGFLDFCHTVNALAAEGHDFDVDIMGSGHSLQDGLALMREGGGASRLVGSGPCPHDDVPARLRLASMMVLPSFDEALPAAVMEAMACGLPVIATNVGGTPELVSHAQDGLLIEPRDVPALVAATRRLVTDSSLARELGHAARERVRRGFDREQGLCGHEQLIEHALGNPRRPSRSSAPTTPPAGAPAAVRLP